VISYQKDDVEGLHKGDRSIYAYLDLHSSSAEKPQDGSSFYQSMQNS
jgi:hypothetical protein